MKWGVDSNNDGKVDYWEMISSEEVGQEEFQALITGDFERLRALFITDQEMVSLKLSDKEKARIKGQLNGAQAKFRTTAAALKSNYRFRQVEAAVPSCVPGETLGMDRDLVHFPTRLILYETTPNTNTYVQTGEMIQVGSSWRLVDAPGNDPTPSRAPLNPIEEKIAKLDAKSFAPNSAEEINRLMDRAGLVQELLSSMQGQNPQARILVQATAGQPGRGGSQEQDCFESTDSLPRAAGKSLARIGNGRLRCVPRN